MRGCTAAFVMIPPDYSAEEVRFYQNKFGEVIAEAIEESGIKKIVSLSSIGADLEAGTGPILGLHDQEQRLDEITHADITHLRAAFFMENLLAGIPTIIAQNRYYGIIPADAPCPMVATRDIASRAAFLLMNPDFDGRNVEYLLGERNLTHREVIKILGKAIGKEDLEYIEVTPEEMKKSLAGAKMTEDWIDQMVEMSQSMGNGTITSTVSRDRINTTQTTIEEFARTTFLEAYNKALGQDRDRKGRDTQSPEARP
jgi:uncharacterized protein YbjT (DUF2867 family)